MKIANKDLYKADLLWGGDGTGMGAHVPVKRAKPIRTAPSESQEQSAVINWWDVYCKTVGIDYRLLFAIPNGAFLGRDPKGRMIQMAVLKRNGLRPGVCDLMLAVPRARHPGLFVEMKSGEGRVSGEQSDFIALVRDQNYSAQVCFGAGQAIDVIKRYVES